MSDSFQTPPTAEEFSRLTEQFLAWLRNNAIAGRVLAGHGIERAHVQPTTLQEFREQVSSANYRTVLIEVFSDCRDVPGGFNFATRTMLIYAPDEAAKRIAEQPQGFILE